MLHLRFERLMTSYTDNKKVHLISMSMSIYMNTLNTAELSMGDL